MKTIRLAVKLIGVMLLILIFSCNDVDENNPLTTPASKFVGKWKTETPVLVKIKTDFCTNVLEDVATMMWDVSWVVTETDDPNVVNITMHYTSSDYTVINQQCTDGTGYLPEPQPMYLKGYIDGNTMSIEYLNEEIFAILIVLVSARRFTQMNAISTLLSINRI